MKLRISNRSGAIIDEKDLPDHPLIDVIRQYFGKEYKAEDIRLTLLHDNTDRDNYVPRE